MGKINLTLNNRAGGDLVLAVDKDTEIPIGNVQTAGILWSPQPDIVDVFYKRNGFGHKIRFIPNEKPQYMAGLNIGLQLPSHITLIWQG